MYTRLTKKQNNKNTGRKNMINPQKETQTKLTKGLIDIIILQLIRNQPMHGYQVITKIRKSYGVYFGPSTIYPLLGTLEKKKLLNSKWDMAAERPRKIFNLTDTGVNMLNFAEESLNLMCKKISAQTNPEITLIAGNQKY